MYMKLILRLIKLQEQDMETIRSYLVLANLIIYLNTKNDNTDKSWSVPKGWEM